MATITFPSNPVLNQIYSYNGNTWIWDGSSWQLLTNAALNAVVIGNVVPESGAFTTVSANSLTVNSLTANSIATGEISANAVSGGTLSGTSLSLSGNVLGALRVQGPVSGTSFSTVGAITTNNGITSYGNISAPFFIGDGSLLTNLPSGTNYSNANVAAYLPTYTGNLQAGNVSILGNIAGNNVSVLGRIVSSGNITGSNIVTGGSVSAAGNIVGNYFFGNGSHLTGINANYSNANVTAYLPTNSANVAGNYFIGNGSLLTNITGANVTGTVPSATTATTATTAATANIANSVAGANVTGAVTSAVNASFAEYAYSVPGAGVIGSVPRATLANVAAVANSVAGANITGTVANATYAITAGSATTAVTATTANVAVVANSVAGANVTGAVATANNANFANYAYSALGAGVIGAVPLANTANTAAVANSVAGANVSGTVANATYAATAGAATTAGTVTTNAQSNITSVGALTSLTVVGNTSGSDLTLSGKASVAGNVTAGRFIGDGSLITNLPTLNYSNANVAAYLPTYTGNLAGGNVSVAGSIVGNSATIAGRITSTASITASGNVVGGNINTGGRITAAGNITGQYFFGNGAFLTGINANYGNANVADYLPTYTGNINGNNGSFTGAVSVAGNVTAGNINSLNALSVVGNVVTANAAVTRTLVANVIQSNSITTSGNIYGTYFLGDARYMTGLPNYTNSNVAAFLPTYTGDLAGNSVSVAGNITGQNLFVFGGVVAANTISAVGNISGGNVTTPGWISSLGNVHAPYYFGDGSHLTNLNINYSNANVAAYLPTYTGNLNPNRVSASGNITAQYFFGNGSQLTGIQATQVGVLPSLSVTGNTVTGNLNTAGNVTGAYFIGDGSQLTNLPVGSNYSNANVAAYLPTYTGNLTANTISTSGNITGRFILGNGSQLTGMYGNTNVATYLTGYTGNITFNNASAAGNITADFFVGNGSLLTGIQATEIGTLESLSVTGNIDTGNINIDGRVSAAGNIITPDTVDTANVIASGVVQATGNITGGNISSIGQVIANGNITVRSGSYFIGNGSQLTGVIASGVAANALVGNTLSSNVLYSSLQTVGTLNSLSVSGNTTLSNVTAGIISATGNITTTGNIKAGTLSSAGNVTGDYILGNGSQLTGIVATEIGTLTSLSVSGNVNIGGYYIGDGGLLSNIQVTTTYGNSNVAAYLPTYTGNLAGSSASVVGTVTANLFVGSGAGLRTLNAANLVGSVPLATYVSANAQSNITSVGTLTSLSVAGNIKTSANVSSNYFVGNGRFLTGVAGTLAGNMVGNITANGYVIEGMTEMSVSGNVTGEYFIGNGAFLTGLPANYGNSNVADYLPTYTGNLAGGNISVTGYVYGNGAFLTGLPAGYSNADVAAYLPTYTGNLTAGNISAAGNVTAQYFVGNGAFLTGLPASYSNANVAAYLPTYTGNITADVVSTTGNITAPYFFGNGSQLTGVTASNVGTLANLSVSGNITSNGNFSTSGNITGGTGQFNGDLNVVGNISATGNINYVDVTDLVVGDPLIYFAANNTGNLLDIGWVGSYDDGTYQHTGLVRDHTDGVWKLFSNVVAEPTTVIDWANAQYDQFQSGQITSTANISAAGNVTASYFIGDGSQLTNLPSVTPVGNAINMGSNTQGSLVSNAVTLTANTTVTNGIALLNQVLGKLVPPAPTNFPGATTLSISSLSTYRMANFTQTDNTPGANKSVSGGSTVTTVRRAASYSTNTVANVGPGDSGTVIAVLNGADAGNVTLSSALTGNGTYSNLVITNNFDYKFANANITAGFWSVFTSQAAGTVSQGWNEVRIADTATANTNTPSWYYDASAPGTPVVGNLSISASTTSLTYSSTVGHYNSTTQFGLSFTANRLSGDMYPTSDTFVTGTAGGAFQAPVSVTYSTAGVTTPLSRNLYVSSGAANISTTSNIVTGFGASTTGPSVSVLNSYATGTGTFTSTLAANVLYKTGTASTMEESNVVVGGTIGSGSGAAYRIANPGSTDTPAFTGSEAAFNSTTGPLQTYDATIVAAVLKHDQTNYSTGYLPVGPDLSSGRSAAQYFTFKIQRSSVSKFDVRWTGTIAGLWVALPGSLIDSTSTLNGWLDMSTAYGGAGAPGANTGAGGNGSNGCALGTVAPLNSAQTNRSITATFGTVSSTSATDNEIYIRIKLTSGQSVTALSLQPASN